MKKMKPPLKILTSMLESAGTHELGWHGRPESLTTHSSRDWLYTKSGLGKEPMWPTREETATVVVKAKRLTLNFAMKFDFPPIVRKVL